MKLALQLSCYNGGRYLPFLFASLKKQTLQDWHLYVLDNASDEENKKLIAQAVTESGLPITLRRVEKNLGFSGAHNLLFKEFTHSAHAIQLLNDDALLEPDFLKSCLSYIETHDSCAAVSGVIYRWNFEERDNEVGGRTSMIDTLGLDFQPTGAVVDRHAGENKATVGIPTEPYDVFGVSGCLPMYRVAAVQKASPEGTLFDGNYVSYKEDVDLAHRLHAFGFTAAIVPRAVAYHRRSLGVKTAHTQGKTRTGSESDFLSYRNHLWTLRKNRLWTPRVAAYEVGKFFFWLTRSPKLVWRMIRDTRNAKPHLAIWRQYLKTAPYRDAKTPQPPEVDIAIILVSHNDLDPACFISLQAAREKTTASTAVVVVDNNSHKYHANELVSEYIPDAWVLLRDGDHGYGRSMNRGAKHVRAKYYFILNPDTALPDGEVFNKLKAYMETHSDVGLIGPRIQGFQGELHDTCRRFPKVYMPFIQRTSLKKTAFGERYLHSFLMKDYDHKDEKAVDWVQGSAMFVDGDLWHNLGGFDDRFWLYFEDIDLCRRVWQAGKKVVYLPTVTISHLHGRQSAKISNIFVNLLKTKESRGHLVSWFKYTLKWLGR